MPRRTIRLAALGLVVSMGAAEAARCTDYSTCEQAVRNWCAGNHRGADRDKDGIPCESVCGNDASALANVRAIQARIGC